jgi:ketosteroid isomerase-like protein
MSWFAVGVVAMVASIAGLAHAAAPASADETAIRAQTASWEKAYNGGDAKGVAAQYADDALLLPPGAPGVSGRAAILQFFTKDIADTKAVGAVFVLNPKTDVGISGNLGWESGTYKVTVKGAVVETAVSLGLQEEESAAHTRYMERGCVACASRSACTAKSARCAASAEVGPHD